jgi:uncharacterized Zn finger protein
VLEESGLWECVSHLPKGMDSVLGKEFDEEGIELFGGESQKLTNVCSASSSLLVCKKIKKLKFPLVFYNHFAIMNGTACHIFGIPD